MICCLAFNACWGAGYCIRKLVSCVCILACGGPVLFIIGIILLVSPNHYTSRVASYNAAVATYNEMDKGRMEQTAAFSAGTASNVSDGIALERSTMPIEIEGNTEDVNDGVSVSFGGDVPISSSATVSLKPVLAHFASGSVPTHGLGPRTLSEATVSVVNFQVPLRKNVFKEMNCNSCNKEKLEDECRATYSGRISGASCNKRKCRGECEFKGYLAYVCIPVSFSTPSQNDSGGWRRSNRIGSCMFPYKRQDDQKYFPTRTTTIKVEIMSDEDPSIALGRETEGKNDFGWTAAQQRGLGGGLLAGGFFWTLCFYGAIGVGLYFLIRKFQQNGDAEAVSQQTQAGHMEQPYSGQAGHGQPGYGQPVTGQPVTGQPGYGQPVTGHSGVAQNCVPLPHAGAPSEYSPQAGPYPPQPQAAPAFGAFTMSNAAANAYPNKV